MVQYNPAVQAAPRCYRHAPGLTIRLKYQYLRQRCGAVRAPVLRKRCCRLDGQESTVASIQPRAPRRRAVHSCRTVSLRPGRGRTASDTLTTPQSAQRRRPIHRPCPAQPQHRLSLAAYNGGEGRAQRVYNASGGRNFWDESVYNQFPAETRDYVPMVIAAAWLFLHPKQYGLTFPKVEAKPAMLKLTRAASIYELTICLGNGGTRDGYMRALRNLNPRYEATVLAHRPMLNAPPRSSLYNLYCMSASAPTWRIRGDD